MKQAWYASLRYSLPKSLGNEAMSLGTYSFFLYNHKRQKLRPEMIFSPGVGPLRKTRGTVRTAKLQVLAALLFLNIIFYKPRTNILHPSESYDLRTLAHTELD